MPDLVNCANCDSIMVANQFRDICQDCYKEEEKQFETVHKYMRKRENRAATMDQIVEATEVPEELLLKFIKNGRIQVKQFPNLGYPCDKCGSIIQTGKLCASCAAELRKEIAIHENEEQRKEELRKQNQGTYFSKK